MNPETAHKVTLWGLRLAEKMRVLPLVMGEVPSDPVEILGMKFPNRVGLAAGMDKEADTVSAFGQAGFGFVEVGTLTPRPQPGNEKPRLFRLIPQKAIINRMGFNNEGIAAGIIPNESGNCPQGDLVGVASGRKDACTASSNGGSSF